MARNKFYSVGQIEQRTERLLAEFQQKFGVLNNPPVPVEMIAEQLFDLHILWDKISAKEDGMILGGLVPSARELILNEEQLEYFRQNDGVEVFTIGHEMGHWDLHVDHGSLYHPVLPGFDRPFQFICRDGDKSWDETNANRYSSCLLLPKFLLSPAITDLDLTKWKSLYKLREVFQVTITALRIRLESLNLVYVSDDGKIYPSKQSYYGQQQLV